MKYFLAAAAFLVLISCGKTHEHVDHNDENEGDDPNRALYDQVMIIHDEVMPKMGDINRISRTIRAELDTVPPIDTLLKLQQLDLLIRLGKAEEGMMVWMNEL